MTAKPTLQDLLDEAIKADKCYGVRGREKFYFMVVEMFGSDSTMTIALIGQIQALQDQIRRMRGDGK